MAEKIDTRSPACTPIAIKPSAAERICWAACGAGDVGPDAVDLALEDDEVGVVALVLEDRGRDVVVLADGKACRDAELTHDSTLSKLGCPHDANRPDPRAS